MLGEYRHDKVQLPFVQQFIPRKCAMGQVVDSRTEFLTSEQTIMSYLHPQENELWGTADWVGRIRGIHVWV